MLLGCQMCEETLLRKNVNENASHSIKNAPFFYAFFGAPNSKLL